MGALWGLGLVALVAACGDGGAPSDAGPADAGLDASPDAGDAAAASPLDEYFAAIDDDACRRAVRCESRWRSRLGWAIERPRTGEQLPCHPAFERVVQDFHAATRRGWRAAVADGRMRFDADAARACLDALPVEAGCPDDLPPDACLGVLSPAAVEGGACRLIGPEPVFSRSYDCSTGLRCVAGDGCDGTCGPPAREGEPCRASSDCDLEDSVFCDLRVGRCTRFQTVGEACHDADGPYCGAGAYCRDGVCAPESGGPGADCSVYRGICERPLWCIREPDGVERCSDPVTGPEGNACIDVYYDYCAPELACFAADAMSLEGTCRRPRVLSEACGENEPCGSSLRCEGGRCLRISLPGEPCSDSLLCPLTHYCSSSATCAPLPLLGEPCVDAGRCFHGLCSAAGVCDLAPDGAECDGVARAPLGSCEGACHQETVGFCRAAVPEGSECSRDDECAALLTCALLEGPELRCTAWCGLHAPPGP